MITRIGTSGFQYPAWKGGFYPADLPVSKMLSYYAGQFSTTEINYTFRSLPSAATIERWADATPANFRFSLKAPQRITHFARLRNCEEVITAFSNAVQPLGKKLGPVLFQLPPNFTCDIGLLREFLAALPKGLRSAWEFRHASWFQDDVYAALDKHRAALCVAESEDLATPRIATTTFGYLRPRREDYKPKDIAQWSDFIQETSARWKETFVYFKHEDTGVGPKFAKQLADLIRG